MTWIVHYIKLFKAFVMKAELVNNEKKKEIENLLMK